MGDLVVTTFDWVPETPRGYVRDLRIRWALEEAGLPYRVESVPFRDRMPTISRISRSARCRG
jgi:glutathione S-transferase